MENFIDIHTHGITSSNDIVSIYNCFLEEEFNCFSKYCSVGLHPWNSNKLPLDDVEKRLLNFVKKKQVIAIGETGLDYFIDASRSLQKQMFQIHIKVAANIGLPLIIHSVKSFNDCIKMLKDANYKNASIFHAFQGNFSQIQQGIAVNAYFSVGHRTLNMNPKGSQIIAQIPLNRLLIESDEHEISIKDLYLAIAKIKGIEPKELKRAIWQNFTNIFGNELVGENGIIIDK